LVLLPALFMSGFGVIAIVNVSQAEKQRRREAAEEVVQAAERRMLEVLRVHPDASGEQLRGLLRPSTADGLQVRLRVDDETGRTFERLINEPVVVEEVVAHRLDAPFNRFTLIAEAPPTSSTRVVVVYIVLLVICVVTLITGVVITARLIYQETRLSRLKTDFVSHMSHELRTPLTSIRLFIETLSLGRAESKQEQQECFDLLAKETERLSEMIERVLGYARMQAGRRVFKEEDVDVQEIVDDAIDAFRAHTLTLAQSKLLTLTTAITPGLPRVRVDRESIVEALLNLIGNAWKYTGPEKKITVFARPGRRGRIVVGVVDNGPGLPKHEHARIFERFYQARSLLSGKTAGSGLGLAITKAIVEGQGGRIGVESEPGLGSTFWIELRPEEKKPAKKLPEKAA
jgi:signal transduction histidine kinase